MIWPPARSTIGKAVHVTYFRSVEHVVTMRSRGTKEENFWTVRSSCVQSKLISACMFPAVQTWTAEVVHPHARIQVQCICTFYCIHLVHQGFKGPFGDSRLPTADFPIFRFSRSAPDEIEMPTFFFLRNFAHDEIMTEE